MKLGQELSLTILAPELVPTYYKAIHEKKDFNDEVRIKLQKKYPHQDLIKDRIKESKNSLLFVVQKEQAVIGAFELRFSPKEDFIELDFWLFREFRKKGIMTKLFPSIIEYAKEKFIKNKLMAVVPLANVPAQHLLLKVGFTKSPNLLNKDYIFYLNF